MDRPDALSRSRCRERRLNNIITVIIIIIIIIIIKIYLLKLRYRDKN